ncbi:winged helix-turn-helix domain-containing protein [Haloarchaeobius salinus]|uniref:winged helix-turn-helix domain-containing protein n=1 Tax=Haloarchaeobius salinus TaxID=1198298 RepID=UPI002108F1E8|nr:winged helix-turn-helix domain-containing protein [Haloarchaeobius salinus]
MSHQPHEESSTWDQTAVAVLQEYPPSVKLVAKVLDAEGELSQREIADESLLPPRTVRAALNRLEDGDHLTTRYSFRDARKRLYTLDFESESVLSRS